MTDHRPFIILPLIIWLAGCVWPGQERVTGPKVGKARTVTTTMPDGKTVVSHEEITTEAATYQGLRVKEADFSDTWVESKADGATEVRGGGITFQGYQLPEASSLKPLYILGGLCIVAGVIVGWIAGWGLGLAIAGAGVALIGAVTLFEQYPWVVLIPVFAGVGVGVYLLIELYRGRSARTAIVPLVQAIETSSAEAASEVKERIATMAGKNSAKVKDTVQKVKRKVGLA